MVEARGVEPLSENLLIQPSTSVVYLLEFPLCGADKQASLAGSFFMLDRLKSKPPMQVHRSFDAQRRVAILSAGTGSQVATALPLGSLCYVSVSV